MLHGGRGAAKSHSIARALLVRGMEKRERILCTRELQVSIADSVHKLLKDQIEALGLGAFYTVTDKRIVGRNGTEFIFAGLRHNISKIKSLEGITICWVEEAQTVSEESWRTLIPTIRAAGSEIWVSFNPLDEKDPTYKRFVVKPPPGAVVKRILWSDNPWFPEELRREKDYDYANDPEAAEHVWGGQTRKISDANVLRGRYSVEPFEPKPEWCGPYQGADWGFSVDPTALVRLWVDVAARTLYVEYEAYGVGVDLDDTPALFDRVPNAREFVTRADPARPETISHMQKHGYSRLTAAVKGPGSVEDGVEHLRSYAKIVIHPRCSHAADEARLWSWKVDPLTGDILPVLIDKHNHIWDAARYALEPLIKSSGTGLLDFMKQQAEEKKRAEDEARKAGR